MKSYLFMMISITFYLNANADILWKAYATMPQLVHSAGYPLEKHDVHTQDGYILKMYRIPRGVVETDKDEKRKAVVLVHGLFGSCDNFIILGPNKSLAFMLADAGYDVWLANLRGNLYTSHKSLTRKDPTFWDYSFDEHGKYDLPALIDKVLNITRLSRVLYIGHSMGCTVFLTMLAQWPEYNDKMVAMVGLAPGGYMDNAKILAKFFGNTLDLPTYFSKNGIRGLMVPPAILELTSDFCMGKQFQFELCMRMYSALCGEDKEQHEWEMTKVMLMRVQPASTRQIFHYMKIAVTGVFTYWEDGFHGRVRPYNLSNVRTPVSLWYGPNDQVTDKTQTSRLAQELNDTGLVHSLRTVAWPKFNHLDFVFAKDVGEILNKELVKLVHELFEKYDKK